MPLLYSLMLFWLAFACQPHEQELHTPTEVNPSNPTASGQPLTDDAEGDTSASYSHLTIAGKYVGVEETSKNSSTEIDRMLETVGLNPGYNYCAAFVSYILDESKVDYPNVRSGVAQHFRTNKSVRSEEVVRGTYKVEKGEILVWQRGETWQGHTGFASGDWEGATGTTIEANTTSGGDDNLGRGNGIWERTRTIQPGNYFRITYITPVKYA